MTVHVDVGFASDSATLPPVDEIARWVRRALTAAGRDSDLEVSVRVVDEAEMQELNRSFRGQDKPTNVLSFPAGDIKGLPPDASTPLGDIVVCAAVVGSEARQQGKSLGDHWAHMLIHGTLHLLGFDHVEDVDADIMEGMEIRVLKDFGIANPYKESPRET
jgi:probable rRNA maturation factor